MYKIHAFASLLIFLLLLSSYLSGRPQSLWRGLEVSILHRVFLFFSTCIVVLYCFVVWYFYPAASVAIDSAERRGKAKAVQEVQQRQKESSSPDTMRQKLE